LVAVPVEPAELPEPPELLLVDALDVDDESDVLPDDESGLLPEEPASEDPLLLEAESPDVVAPRLSLR
jgi:hypothetical protein